MSTLSARPCGRFGPIVGRTGGDVVATGGIGTLLIKDLACCRALFVRHERPCIRFRAARAGRRIVRGEHNTKVRAFSTLARGSNVLVTRHMRADVLKTKGLLKIT